jgi:hypothetical protein
VLSRGAEQRRIAWWVEIAANRLSKPVAQLSKPGLYRGTTKGRASRVSAYLFPSGGGVSGVPTRLAGPEVVYRVRVAQPVANFGVVITSRGRKDVEVVPRIVFAGNEHRLAGYAALPLNLNPYLRTFLTPEPVSGVALPLPGLYDVVFDTTLAARAGAFTFRYWVNDTRPPRIALLNRTVPRGGTLKIKATDTGSGVDPRSVYATVDGRPATLSVDSAGSGRMSLRPATAQIGAGTHQLVLQVSDYQEAKNNENQPRILGNTTRISTTFAVR